MQHFRVVEVAAVHASNISAALTQMNKVFMWGQVRGQTLSLPQETRFQCVDDVFACFSSPSVSCRSLKFGKQVHVLGSQFLVFRIFLVVLLLKNFRY